MHFLLFIFTSFSNEGDYKTTVCFLSLLQRFNLKNENTSCYWARISWFWRCLNSMRHVHSSKADRNVYFSSRRTHKKDHSMSRLEDSVHVGVWFGSRHHTPCSRPMYWMSLSTSYPVRCIKCLCTWQANHRMKILWYLWPRLSSDAFIWRCTWAQCISGFIMIFELASYDPIWVSAFVYKGVNRSMYEAGSFNQPFSSFEAQAPKQYIQLLSGQMENTWSISKLTPYWPLLFVTLYGFKQELFMLWCTFLPTKSCLGHSLPLLVLW